MKVYNLIKPDRLNPIYSLIEEVLITTLNALYSRFSVHEASFTILWASFTFWLDVIVIILTLETYLLSN